MVVFEVALTIVLLVGAGLMVRSFFKLYAMDLGFRAERLLTSRMVLAEQKYPSPAERRVFQDRLLTELASIPGIAAASLTTAPPLGGGGSPRLEIEGRTTDRTKAPEVTWVQATDGHFDTLQLPIIRGRSFRPTDGTEGNEAAILRRGLVQLGIGLALGLVGSYFISGALQSLIIQMQPTDPVTVASVSVLLLVVTVVACLVPARRATRLDPVVALRAE